MNVTSASDEDELFVDPFSHFFGLVDSLEMISPLKVERCCRGPKSYALGTVAWKSV